MCDIPMNEFSNGASTSQSGVTSRVRIDAHHHLWCYRADEFGWISDEMAALRKDFMIDELCHQLQVAGIDGTVVVQARESVEETEWLLKCALSAPVIRGVVGWAPLAAEELPTLLDAFTDGTHLVGVREVIQAKPKGYLDRANFNRGIRQLTARELAYDILIHAHQLPEAVRLADRHPQQRFVLDHAAKPKICANEIGQWSRDLYELAQRENVSCKISGLTTEAHWQSWTLELLRPYLDVCVNAFGTKRLLAGSDWPVCLLATTYAHWWSVLEQYFEQFTKNDIVRIFGGNALEIYRLQI